MASGKPPAQKYFKQTPDVTVPKLDGNPLDMLNGLAQICVIVYMLYRTCFVLDYSIWVKDVQSWETVCSGKVFPTICAAW